MEDRQQQLELMQTEFDHLLQIIDHNSSQLEGTSVIISYNKLFVEGKFSFICKENFHRWLLKLVAIVL